MTEAEWLACDDPLAMLQEFREVSQRKGKLFVAGCCRQHTSLFQNRLNRKAFLAVEDFADGLISYEEIHSKRGNGKAGYRVASACSVVVPTPIFISLAIFLTDDSEKDKFIAIRTVREVFGNPFRPVAVDSAWRTSTVLALARQIYESRDFSPMPILADALQDTGCEHDDILSHCRGAGQHVRGCWVIDLLLGKE